MPIPSRRVALILALTCAAQARAGDPTTYRPTAPAVGTDACPNGGIRLGEDGACLWLNGRMTVEGSVSDAGYRSKLTRGWAMHARTAGMIAVDVRIPSELGPIRAYAELRTPIPRQGR